jgi:curved DNA-binding protein CbpA
VLERANGPAGHHRPWRHPRATPYEILGVDEDASPAVIRRAYLRLVQVWHPDRFPKDSALQREAESATKCLNEAYWVQRPAKRGRFGAFHRTRHSSRPADTGRAGAGRAGAERSQEDRAWSTGALADWDGRRILYLGLAILVMVVWLAASALLFWVLFEWY